MDRNEAIQKAKQFARTAYAAAVDQIAHKHQDDLVKMQNQLAARGMVLSGATITEKARIFGNQIRASTEAWLNATLEGYELYGVVIDDQMAVNICDDAMQGMNQMVAAARKHTFIQGMPVSATAAYPQLVARNVGISAAWVKTQIDRRRLLPKKNEVSTITTIYNVQGDNARVSVNSSDHSVNIVTKSKEEFVGTLQQRIECRVQDGEERQKILSALTALQESQGKPEFAGRYTDFIATSANHVALLTPFIPALTDMLHRILS